MMRKYSTLTTALLLSAFSAVSFGAEHVVKMLNSGKEGGMIFEPSVLKVDVGDSVTFKATDGGHNASSVPGLIPSGADAWNGKINQDITVKFDKAGVYVYQCIPHVVLAMVGVISVGEPTNLQQIITDSAGLQKSFVMNKERLSSYLAEVK
jgi:pseudoazurin